jgi:hypothetical protein
MLLFPSLMTNRHLINDQYYFILSYNKAYKTYIYTVRHFSSSPQWWFHDPFDASSSHIRQPIINLLKYSQLTNRHFHWCKAYNPFLKSLVLVDKKNKQYCLIIKNSAICVFSFGCWLSSLFFYFWWYLEVYKTENNENNQQISFVKRSYSFYLSSTFTVEVPRMRPVRRAAIRPTFRPGGA